MPSSSQFDENASPTMLAGHCWLPLTFAISGEALDSATICTLVVNSEVCHIVHARLRDQPPLFEGVLCDKECSWVVRGTRSVWQEIS